MNILNYNIRIIDTFENDRVLAEERTQQAAPELQFNGSDDKYSAVMASEFVFNFSVPDVEDGKFFHLYTGNETRYRCELSDQDNAVLWQGFLMPDQYSEPYKNGHFFVGMTATDGLGRLKGKYLPYAYYNKETSVIKLIAECLKLTGLAQPINFAPAVVAAAVVYRWDEIAVDGTTYRDDKEARGFFGTSLPKRDNAYEILERLLLNLGCTLFTWAQQWYIIGINRKHETTCATERYSPEGAFIENASFERPVHRIKFENTPPLITIISPWSSVQVAWAIDEAESLLPKYAITEDPDRYNPATGNAIVDAGSHGLPFESPLKHWQKSGTINAAVGSAEGKVQLDFTGGSTFVLPYPVGPYNLQVGKRYTNAFGQTISGETTAGTAQNWVELSVPKYIKVSDFEVFRRLTFKIGLFAKGGSQDLIDENTLQDAFRIDIMCGDTVVLSNRPGQPGEANFKYELDFRDRADEITGDNPNNFNVIVITLSQTSAELEKELIKITQNGFANLRLYAPVCPNPAEAPFFEYVITDLEFDYTAQDEHTATLVRNIDFTTSKKFDVFHGDSIQDLSKKQFRFRRPVVFDAENHINIFSYSETTIPGSGAVVFYYAISYQQALLVQQNPALLTVTFEGEIYTINQLYPLGAYGTPGGWNVVQLAGVWYIALVKIDVVGIWASVTNFLDMNLAADGVQNGFYPENNEWRESWKRFGVDENRRFCDCLARMYHDVQPGPIASIEGTLFGLYSPLELMVFHWREDKVFMPLRLNLSFSEGKTNATIQETTIENINDYLLWNEG